MIQADAAKVKEINDDPNPGKLPFIDMSTWDTTPLPVRQWWVPDRFPLRQPALLSGEGAIGKSILALQLLVATVLKTSWLDMFEPLVGPAIYLGCEDERDEIRRRLAPILDYHERRFSDLIEGGFKTLAYAGENAVLATFDRSGCIQQTELFKQLHRTACALRPKGIVIDTVSDVFLGDEIKRDQVRQFGNLLRKLAIDSNSTVLVNSHPSLTGLKSGSGLSGSTQWHNSVRARAYFRKPDSGDDDDETESNGTDDGSRELQFMKNQYGPLGQTIALKWSNGLWLPTTVTGSEATNATVENLFLQLLDRFTAQDRDVSAKKSPTYAPAQFAATPEARKTRVSSKAFADAMERLYAQNTIKTVIEGPPSRQRTRIARVITPASAPPSPAKPDLPVSTAMVAPAVSTADDATFKVIGPEPDGTRCDYCGGSDGVVYLIRCQARGVRSYPLHEQCAEPYFESGQ
jgi:RecA-family ATPase